MACRCKKFQAPTFQSLSIDKEGELQSLLRSNVDAEGIAASTLLAAAKDDLERCEKELAVFEAERERIEAIVGSLQNQRHALQRFTLDAESLRSPIRKLSTELLQRIFVQFEAGNCILSDWICIEALRVAQVCRYWRDVALMTRELWCNLTIQVLRNSRWTNRHETLVNLVLKRSCQHPLTLCYYGERSGSFVDVLRAQSHRWRHLDLTGPNSRSNNADLIPTEVLPSLRYLQIPLVTWCRSPAFSVAVTSLTLDGPTVPLAGSTSIPQMIALLHLEINYLPIDSVRHLLGLCPNLVSLSFHGCHLDSPSSFMLINLRNLTTLVIIRCKLKAVSKLFSNLALPKLNTISILTGVALKNTGHQPTSPSLLIRSSASLTVFAICQASIPPIVLIPLLRLMPDLETLSLYEPSSSSNYTLPREHDPKMFMIDSDLLTSLTLHPDFDSGSSPLEAGLVPKLTCLSLEICHPLQVDSDVLVRILLDLITSHPDLVSVDLKMKKERIKSPIPSFAHLRKDIRIEDADGNIFGPNVSSSDV